MDRNPFSKNIAIADLYETLILIKLEVLGGSSDDGVFVDLIEISESTSRL